jgi:hypothetical protein
MSPRRCSVARARGGGCHTRRARSTQRAVIRTDGQAPPPPRPRTRRKMRRDEREEPRRGWLGSGASAGGGAALTSARGSEEVKERRRRRSEGEEEEEVGSSPPPHLTTIVYLAPERADDRSRARRRAASVLRSRCFGIAPESVAGRLLWRVALFSVSYLPGSILLSARNRNAGMCVDGKGARTKHDFQEGNGFSRAAPR